MSESAPEQRRLLVLAKPPKKVNEMSQEERKAWANAIFDRMAANYRGETAES